MADSNPFSGMRVDLGVGDAYGYNRDSATDNILRDAYSSRISCYICGNEPHARIVHKKPKYDSAELQKGLYVCNHCISTMPVDNSHYGLRKLQ